MAPKPFEWRHPELRENEVFLGYFDENTIRYVDWKSARRGQLAIPNEPDLFSVFVQRDELERAGIKIDGEFNVNLHDNLSATA